MIFLKIPAWIITWASRPLWASDPLTFGVHHKFRTLLVSTVELRRADPEVGGLFVGPELSEARPLDGRPPAPCGAPISGVFFFELATTTIDTTAGNAGAANISSSSMTPPTVTPSTSTAPSVNMTTSLASSLQRQKRARMCRKTFFSQATALSKPGVKVCATLPAQLLAVSSLSAWAAADARNDV